MDQLSNLNIGFALVFLLLIDIYSSFLLKLNFNCCHKFALSWVDKVTIGRQSCVLIIANIVASFSAALDTTQSAKKTKLE